MWALFAEAAKRFLSRVWDLFVDAFFEEAVEVVQTWARARVFIAADDGAATVVYPSQ